MALDLSSAPTAPPRSARNTRQAPARTVSAKTTEREEAVNGLFQLTAFGFVLVKWYADAGAINMHGPNIAHEFAVLADKNESIAKGIDYLTEAGPYAGVIIAVLPLAMQIMANHNVIKAEHVAGGGVVHPQVLESQVKADMARQAAQALAQQREAEAQLRALAEGESSEDGSQGSTEPNGKAPSRRVKANA